MKKNPVSMLALASLVIAGSAALAADTAAPKSISVHDKVTIKATVEAIDHSHRIVDLKGPQGNVVSLYVDSSVTRFDKMKVGDVVTAQYYESVVYEVQKPDAPVAPDTITDGSGKLSGEKPGGAIGVTSVSTVTIVEIDPATPAVKVKTSDGAMLSFRVRDRNNLKGVKVGDRVKVTETAALMIAVDPAK
jgi:Cu/Ag efflux protein CusF